MNIDVLREEITADEGCKYEIYLDHLDLPTFGIGHLIRVEDPEYGKPVGTEVSEERVKQAFNLDILSTLEDCRRLYPEWDTFGDELQHIIANMMFNLGYPRLERFRNMWSAVRDHDYNRAADEMVDSKWYTQVPNRARRLVGRMRNLVYEQDAG